MRIDSTTDIEGIARYWNAAGQVGAMRPLLDALMRVRGRFAVGVAALLPPLPRGQLNRYPAVDDPAYVADNTSDPISSDGRAAKAG